MSLLKAPPKQPKNATLQLRVDEELKIKLDKYAEFLDSTESYVVSEALKLIFNKDTEFKEWMEHQQENDGESTADHVFAPAGEDTRPTGLAPSAHKPNGNRLFT
jgi:predicted transcriptional regulator